MNLSNIILEYADKRGQFQFQEIFCYCREQGNIKMNEELSSAAVSACLRRLKLKGQLWNNRNWWFLRKQNRS